MESRLFSKPIGVTAVYVNTKDGSLPKKKLIFYPIIMSTAKNLEPEKDISYEGDKTKFSGMFLFPPQSAFKVL